MPYPIKDCNCEDFPCCEHADNFGPPEPEYCDVCGWTHSPTLDCQAEDDDLDEWEKALDHCVHCVENCTVDHGEPCDEPECS
jgi:hypothetical protein